MANFLVVVSPHTRADQAGSLFRRGLEAARHLSLGTPKALAESSWFRVATLPRPDGSGVNLVRDPLTGDWLVAIGTWFHRDGFASGAEARLLARIAERGADEVASELEGFFVVVHGSARTHEVEVVTDIVGSCHAFTRVESGLVAVSGSSLLLATLADGRLDPVAAQELLAHGVIYEDRTLHREVRKLRAARVHRISASGAQVAKRYWDVAALPHGTLSAREAADAIWDGLVRAANRISALHPRVVADLTGGRDSRMVVGAFLGSRRRFGTAVVGPDGSPDVEVSRSLAAKLRLPHEHLKPVRPSTFREIAAAIPYTDGEYDLVEYSTILDVHRTLSRAYTTSVNGSFGEVARAYWHDVVSGGFDARRLSLLRFAKPFDGSVIRPSSRLDFVEHYACAIERTIAGTDGAPATAKLDAAYLHMRMQRWQGRIATATNRLWPCLSPFLLRSVLEPAILAPSRSKRESLLARRMLARHERRLAAHPLDDGTPALPVTPFNVWRFWRLPIRDAKRVLQKTGLLRKSAPASGIPTRMRLWLDDAVRELLQPRRMRAAEILEPSRLQDFLERAQRREFAHEEQWNRILTLEATLDTVARVRARLAASDRVLRPRFTPAEPPPPAPPLH